MKKGYEIQVVEGGYDLLVPVGSRVIKKSFSSKEELFDFIEEVEAVIDKFAADLGLDQE